MPSTPGMDPSDSISLLRFRELQTVLDESGGDSRTVIELAHVLHDLRRDKPALDLLLTVPIDSLGMQDRLFLASLQMFDSDLSSAFATAAPICIVPIIVTAATISIFAVIHIRRRKERNG